MADPTTYVVLREMDDMVVVNSSGWEIVNANVLANSGEAAIRQAATGLPERPDGAYVAVPIRSWQPLTVTATTQTVIKLSDATAHGAPT